MVKFMIANLLDGRKIQTIPDVLSGSWSEKLNSADALSCTVPLNDPVIRRLHLANSATPGKSVLIAADGNTILAAGPIWGHDYQDDGRQLTLIAEGMWSYFDHRVLLPLLAGRLPSDPTVTTRYTNVSVDPNDPWPTDTRKSLQGIARALVAQAQTWTGGNVPVILPAEIAGTAERTYKGSDLAFVGERLAQLTQVDGGPDIKFQPRFTADKMGVEWVMLIGTPTQPQIFGAIEPTFNVGLKKSSVSGLKVSVDGSGLGSQAFASGGNASDQVLITQSNDATLTNAGFPLLELVDSNHSSVTELPTLQGYSDEMVVGGRKPIMTFSFDHDTSRLPFLPGFNVGDYAKLKIRNNAYLDDGTYRVRITGRSGDAQTRKVALTFQAGVN